VLGDFGVVIRDGSVRLGHGFIACMAATPEPTLLSNERARNDISVAPTEFGQRAA